MAPDTNITDLDLRVCEESRVRGGGWHAEGATGKMEFWHEVHLQHVTPSQTMRMYITGSNCSLCHAATCDIAEE